MIRDKDKAIKDIEVFLSNNETLKKFLADIIFPKNSKSTAEQLYEALEKFADSAIESVKAAKAVDEEKRKHVSFELTNINFDTMEYTVTATALDEMGKEILKGLGLNEELR